jgi:hypothetical protein
MATKKVVARRRRSQKTMRKVAALLAAYYASTTIHNPVHTSIRTGRVFMLELRSGSPRRFVELTRMPQKSIRHDPA